MHCILHEDTEQDSLDPGQSFLCEDRYHGLHFCFYLCHCVCLFQVLKSVPSRVLLFFLPHRVFRSETATIQECFNSKHYVKF